MHACASAAQLLYKYIVGLKPLEQREVVGSFTKVFIISKIRDALCNLGILATLGVRVSLGVKKRAESLDDWKKDICRAGATIPNFESFTSHPVATSICNNR